MVSVSLAVKRQFLAAFTGSMATFIGGTFVGWPAPTLKKLREADSPIHLTPSEEAWVVNALYITTIFSPLFGSALMNLIGRRATMLFLCLASTSSWVLVFFSTSAVGLVAGRILAGVWMGGGQTIIPIYVAEISEAKVRGLMGTFFMVNMFMGSNFTFLIGPYVSFRMLAVLCGVLPVLYLACFSLCPESPYFYVMRGRNERAVEALTWLRGGAPVETELRAIKTSIEKDRRDKGYFGKMLDLVIVPANRKAFIILQVMNFFMRFSGITTLQSYSSVILPQQVGYLSSDNCTMLMGLALVVGCLICTCLVDVLGRLPLLYLSSVGITLSMVWTGVWYFLHSNTSVDVTPYNWLPAAGLLTYGCAFSVGLGPISGIIRGELFGASLKGPASALAAVNNALTSALSTAMFAALMQSVGVYANFFIFAATGVANLVFTYLYVIETKGKSLQDIQDELSEDKKLNEKFAVQ